MTECRLRTPPSSLVPLRAEVSRGAGRRLPAASSIATPCDAPVAQLDRVSASEEVELKFEIGQNVWGIRDFEKSVYPQTERSDRGVTKRRSAGRQGNG
jgi:hypothetical protein